MCCLNLDSMLNIYFYEFCYKILLKDAHKKNGTIQKIMCSTECKIDLVARPPVKPFSYCVLSKVICFYKASFSSNCFKWCIHVALSRIPRPLPDFISQLWRKIARRPGIIVCWKLELEHSSQSGKSLALATQCCYFLSVDQCWSYLLPVPFPQIQEPAISTKHQNIAIPSRCVETNGTWWWVTIAN